MKFLRTLLVTSILLFMDISLAVPFEIITLPKPNGSYSIGTDNVELCDPSRKMLRGNEKKCWMVTIFYPAEHRSGTYPYMPGTLEDSTVSGVRVMSFAKPKAPALLTEKFPLIIFVPGRGNERQKYTILCEALASQGYIVMAMDQPYVANFVKLADGRKITLVLKDAWKVPRDRDYRYQYDDEAIEEGIQDISYLLDHLDVFDEVSQAFDKNKIILMGHSLGANTAHIMGFNDQRVKAVVDIDSKITERKIRGHVGVPPNPDAKPVLFIRGMMQYQEDVGDQLSKISNSTLWSPYVQHSAFSDDAYFATKIPGYGRVGFWGALWSWFFKRGPCFSNTDTNLGGKNVYDWFSEYPKVIVQWLKENTSHKL